MKSRRDVIFHDSSLYNKASKPSDDHSPMWDDVPSKDHLASEYATHGHVLP